MYPKRFVQALPAYFSDKDLSEEQIAELTTLHQQALLSKSGVLLFEGQTLLTKYAGYLLRMNTPPSNIIS